MSQAHHWSEAAADYEALFIDPYAPGSDNPLPALLAKIPQANQKVVADLGCGTGPLLPLLARTFGQVHAIDFASGMLDRARECVKDCTNVALHTSDLTRLPELGLRFDVAVAVNSLVMPDLAALEATLVGIHACLNPGGRFFAVLPAMDGIQYHSLLLLDHFREQGLTAMAARSETARVGEHALYDFTWSAFRYRGLDQHFWQPYEIPYRFGRAGFVDVRQRKLRLTWNQLALGARLAHLPAPWDWLVRAGKA